MRANQTLQGLVKEMRLRSISSSAAGNEFVPEFRSDFDRRFAVVPQNPQDAHCPLLPGDDLDHILTWQETRTLSKNLTLQYRKVVYQIQTTRPTYALHSAKVTVCENAQGEITILYKGNALDYAVYHKQQRQAEVVSSKSIDQRLKQPVRPAENHPWRRYGQHLNGKPTAKIAQRE